MPDISEFSNVPHNQLYLLETFVAEKIDLSTAHGYNLRDEFLEAEDIDSGFADTKI